MIHNIVNSSQIKQNQAVRKKKSASDNGGFSSLIVGSESDNNTTATSGTNASGATMATASLLGVTFNLATSLSNNTAREENINWSNNILEKLNQLRFDILQGNISLASLKALNNELSSNILSSGDEKLDNIVNEIRIRASVELAKYDKANQN